MALGIFFPADAPAFPLAIATARAINWTRLEFVEAIVLQTTMGMASVTSMKCMGAQTLRLAIFNLNATEDNGVCFFLDAIGVCGGNCAGDEDGDGICDNEDTCFGTLDVCGVCNGQGAIYSCGCYEIEPGACDCDGNMPDAVGVCDGDCESDENGNGICDEIEAGLCGTGAVWNPDTGQCEIQDACPGDFDGNGSVAIGDLLTFLALFDSACP